MTQRFCTILATILVCAALGCTNSEPLAPLAASRPVLQQAPADGNGTKVIIPVVEFLPNLITCKSGAMLSVRVLGWIQFNELTAADREVRIFHLVFTFSNAAGQTFVWRNIDSDHFYIDKDGNLIDAIVGRHGVGDELHGGVIGRLVINVTTRTVEFVAGQNVDAGDRACAALG